MYLHVLSKNKEAISRQLKETNAKVTDYCLKKKMGKEMLWLVRKGKKYASARDRTTDLKIFSLTLSQLSYKGNYSTVDPPQYTTNTVYSLRKIKTYGLSQYYFYFIYPIRRQIYKKDKKISDSVKFLSFNVYKLYSLMSVRQRRKVAQNHVFHIKIGPNSEKLNIKDPGFLKILEQEYATRYLENLGVEATQKNIYKILKENPLQNCQIVESRLNGGLHTDTITIITKTADDSLSKKVENQTVSGEMLQVLNLKPMKLKKQINYLNSAPSAQQQKKQKLPEKEQVNLEILSFDIKSIKQRYIFPFNENFKRKINYRMKDSNAILDFEKQDSKIIYEAKIFHFPFTQVKLSIKVLKQLQSPINTKLTDILAFLDKYYQQFPTSIFPITTQKKNQNNHIFSSFLEKTEQVEPSKKKSQQQKYNHIIFQQKDVDKAFEIVKSQENAKLIGVFLHLVYWSIFGGVNPIQVDRLMKRKMYTMMVESIEYFQIKMENKRIWSILGFPLLLLTLKMASHYFFSMQYPKLFQSEETIKSGANQIAIDKILYFIQKLFDQGNINGRFIFLQSDIDGQKGNFIKDKKFIRKRIFGTSPALNLALTDPKNGKTRSIMAKNMQIDQQDGTIGDQAYLKQETIDKQSQQKLLNLALHKIKVRVDELNGGANPIINLQDS